MLNNGIPKLNPDYEHVFYINKNKIKDDGFYYYEFVPKYTLDLCEYRYFRHKEWFVNKIHGGNNRNLTKEVNELIWGNKVEMTESEYVLARDAAMEKLIEMGFEEIDYKNFRKIVGISTNRCIMQKRINAGKIYPEIFISGNEICKKPI